ncbi:MAG: hypothetical protein KBB37_13615 [Bacteroidia bacterium]|nr:hypothetical protein [Bacteroidia bacterium]
MSILVACVDEEGSAKKNTFWNLTTHKVTVNYFRQGSSLPDKNIYLIASERKEISYGHRHGSGPGLAYAIEMSELADSAIVAFDDSITITHHSYRIPAGTTGAIAQTSTRSIFNSLSYVGTKQIKGKLPIYEDTYFITDSDYLYALDH